ncbi:ComF family protein [Flavobacteriaceae bacterium]|nr:ComF family protein [Flavobacteriaceae bacterium]
MLLNHLINVFFPKVCFGCLNILSDNEHLICTSCRHDLPLTNYHFNNIDSLKKIFYGRVHIENATALLLFEKKGIVQQLLHQLKYKGQENIGTFLGKWLGHELAAIDDYKTIDVVIPVPLHKRKQRKRGFNQVAKFGIEIAEALGVVYRDNVLIKITNTETQVFKNRMARWQQNTTTFTLKNSALIANKHILLVDDIITTGATLESCINVLNLAENIKVSVASMAFTA